MIKILISKEDFVSCINDIKDTMEYQNDLNKLFNKHNVDGYLYQPDCSAMLIRLLNKIFCVSSQDNYIEKFCFDTDFGKKHIDGMFLDAKNREIEINSPEELYDLLISLAELD